MHYLLNLFKLNKGLCAYCGQPFAPIKKLCACSGKPSRIFVLMIIHSKLPNAGTTIFTIMSQLAVEHKAINLGQGFPDYMMSDELINLVTEAMKKGSNQYPHTNGM